MGRAGFVLVGGRSSRMDRDKALLPFYGRTLVDHIAGLVAAAAGSVSLVGRPERYRHLPYPLIPDQRPGLGPLAGIHAALGATAADWNLVVACDMPALTAEFLGRLFEEAEDAGADCVVPLSPAGLPEPLCAVYHRRCHTPLSAWLDSGRRKASDWVRSMHVIWHPAGAAVLQNVNTPADWQLCQTPAAPDPAPPEVRDA